MNMQSTMEAQKSQEDLFWVNLPMSQDLKDEQEYSQNIRLASESETGLLDSKRRRGDGEE